MLNRLATKRLSAIDEIEVIVPIVCIFLRAEIDKQFLLLVDGAFLADKVGIVFLFFRCFNPLKALAFRFFRQLPDILLDVTIQCIKTRVACLLIGDGRQQQIGIIISFSGSCCTVCCAI